MIMAGLWRYGDWRHVATGCTVLVRTYIIFNARSELRKVLFLALSVTFLFVYEISREPPNGFATNSQRRRVWSLARTLMLDLIKSSLRVTMSAICATVSHPSSCLSMYRLFQYICLVCLRRILTYVILPYAKRTLYKII